MPEKNYSAKVGIHGFKYALLTSDGDDGFTTGELHDVRYLQSISVSPSQEMQRAYGDNRVAETATSNGTTEVGLGFHEIPMEDRQILLGYEDEDGMIIRKGDQDPPNVAVLFFQNKADGSEEVVGLTKGKFMVPEKEGATKEDSLEFSSQEISGEFDPRLYDDVSEVMMHIPKDDTESLEKVYAKVFNKTPDGEDIPEA